MNKGLWSVIGVLLLAVSGCASLEQTRVTTDPQMARPSRAEIEASVVRELQHLGETELAQEEQLDSASDTDDASHFPITINDQVEYFIDYYQTKMPKRFAQYLARSSRYVPMMTAILKEYGLPEDLVYMALIESGFTNRATSRAGAVGPWQFMKATGKRFNLRIDSWVDERQDPVKATHAAAQYLQFLYGEFGSWYLAAAAYNAGENKIGKALSRYQATDFWSISTKNHSYLANETKQYVPRMIAAAIIAKDPEKYGFADVPYEPALAYDEITVQALTSLPALAKASGLTLKQLTDLNPELKKNAVPPGVAKYTLRVPLGAGDMVTRAYAALPPAQRITKASPGVIIVPGGATLSGLAKTYKTTVAELQALNPSLKKNVLRQGQKLVVPNQQAATAQAEPKSAPPKTLRGNDHKITHVVQPGDTIWQVARNYNLDYRDVQRWNPGKKTLTVGSTLVLYAPAAKVEGKVETSAPKAAAGNKKTRSESVYTVKKGDSLWTISRRFNVSTENLKRWNNLRSNNLSIGDRLVVRQGG